MTSKYFFHILMSAAFFIALSSSCYASDGGPKVLAHIRNYQQALIMLSDTIPPIKKMPDIKTDSLPKAITIKEVPKSKKQVVPVALPVSIKLKPIKVIQPKILKPIIKIN
ncbi:MAG: hypothetical protein ABJB11_17940 [Ferruginibacter sp.]